MITDFFEIEAEVGSYFKGTKTNFKIQGFCLNKPFQIVVTKLFSPAVCFGKALKDLMTN